MKNYLELYGKTFQLLTRNCGIRHKKYDDIYHAYAKPSDNKKAIWENWKLWERDVFRDNNDISMYIVSTNCNFFSIGGYIHTPTDEHYGFYITSTRQEIWTLDD